MPEFDPDFVNNAKRSTAKINYTQFCRECHWPVVFCCCNDNFPGAGEWDWWVYCANKGCKNHHGEGVFQNTPQWVYHIWETGKSGE